MKKNKLCLGLSAALLITVFSGCGAEPDTPTVQPTRNTAPLISTAPTTTPPAIDFEEPTAPTEPAPCLEPVTRLSALEWKTLPQFVSLGDGQVLACRNDYQEGKGVINLLDVLDVYRDTVLAQTQNSSPQELVQQQFSDGHFILADPENNTFRVYDSQLKVTKKFSAPKLGGYFSQDRSNYYFVDNDVLYRMDVATGNYARMSLEYDLRFESLIGVHPTQNLIVAKFYRSFYRESTGVCAINCNNGRFALLNENVTHLWFSGEKFYAATPNDTVYGSDICYGDFSGSVLQRAASSSLGSDTVSYTMLPGSGYMIHRTVDDNNLTTTVYDMSQEGICSKLEQYDYATSTLSPVYLPQEQLIFGVYPQEGSFYPVVIDPKVLKYEKSLSTSREVWSALVDKSVIIRYQMSVEGPALPQDLTALRQQADVLEQKYGVKILIENQALEICSSYASVEADAALIDQALTQLDQTLALYPKGFLRQFQNQIGEGGLYFCLTGTIHGSLNPVGKALKNRNRYELLLDIHSPELDKTVHHELWHAIEMKISTDSFDAARWSALNPKGFLYYSHYDSGYQNLTQWTYAESRSQCYFVDAYARINPREDRARLMEYAMSDEAEDLLQSATLRKKLQLMSDTIRAHFDIPGSQTPLWEKYL